MEFKDYSKYRWFYTSSGKLVVGGKNALQNEQLLRILRAQKKERLVMHTSEPGSPFSIILADIGKLTKNDTEECAIFTASFSKAWKEGKKNALVDIFKLSQLYKLNIMKPGTWGVKDKIERKSVPLELVLTKQENVLRAVPEKSVKLKRDILLKISPGKIDKALMLPKFQLILKTPFSQEELITALPSGGVKINKNEL